MINCDDSGCVVIKERFTSYVDIRKTCTSLVPLMLPCVNYGWDCVPVFLFIIKPENPTSARYNWHDIRMMLDGVEDSPTQNLTQEWFSNINLTTTTFNDVCILTSRGLVKFNFSTNEYCRSLNNLKQMSIHGCKKIVRAGVKSLCFKCNRTMCKFVSHMIPQHFRLGYCTHHYIRDDYNNFYIDSNGVHKYMSLGDLILNIINKINDSGKFYINNHHYDPFPDEFNILSSSFILGSYPLNLKINRPERTCDNCIEGDKFYRLAQHINTYTKYNCNLLGFDKGFLKYIDIFTSIPIIASMVGSIYYGTPKQYSSELKKLIATARFQKVRLDRSRLLRMMRQSDIDACNNDPELKVNEDCYDTDEDIYICVYDVTRCDPIVDNDDETVCY